MYNMRPRFPREVLGLSHLVRPSAGGTGVCPPNRIHCRYCRTADTGAWLVRHG